MSHALASNFEANFYMLFQTERKENVTKAKTIKLKQIYFINAAQIKHRTPTLLVTFDCLANDDESFRLLSDPIIRREILNSFPFLADPGVVKSVRADLLLSKCKESLVLKDKKQSF